MVHQHHLQLLQPRRKRRSGSSKEKQFVRFLDAWTALVVETQEPDPSSRRHEAFNSVQRGNRTMGEHSGG